MVNMLGLKTRWMSFVLPGRRLFPFLLLLLLPSPGTTQTVPFSAEIQSLVDSVSVENIYTHVQALSWAGGTQSRVALTPGNYWAAEYIANYLSSLPGLTTVKLDTFYISELSATSNYKEAKYNSYPIINVVATLQGSSSAPEIILLGGHYDTSASRESNNSWDSNWENIQARGADDNASGVAAMMEIARILSDSSKHFANLHTIKFIAFAEEESNPVQNQSHIGSLFDAYYMKQNKENLTAALILDMIAYNTDIDYIEVIANTPSMPLARTVYANASLYVPDLSTSQYPANVTYSDHESYWRNGFQAILLMENDKPWNDDPPNYVHNVYYHTTADSLGTLRPTMFKKVTQLAIANIAYWSQKESTSAVLADHFTEKIDDNGGDLSAYPNPFNAATTLHFSLEQAAEVEIKIFNAVGQVVAVLCQNQFFPIGANQVSWQGDSFASGLYFCVIRCPSYTRSIKLALLK